LRPSRFARQIEFGWHLRRVEVLPVGWALRGEGARLLGMV